MAKKILLADDSITIQKVVELTFSDGDYEVTAVNNGAKAIQKLSEMRPDIVLSDIIMPEKNGYEVCEFIKSHPEFRSIPVVLLTGTFEPFDPERAEKAGCDAVVTKPFESQSLIHKIDELINASRSSAAANPQTPAAASPAAAAPLFAPAAPAAAAEAPAAWPPPTPVSAPLFEPPADSPFSSPAAEAPFEPGSGETLTHGSLPHEEHDIFGSHAPQAAPISFPSPSPSPASPESEAFSGETRAFPRMSFDDLQPPSSAQPPSAAPSFAGGAAEPPPPSSTSAADASPWDTSEPEAPAFGGETRAFPRMSFDDLQAGGGAPAPSAPPAAPAEDPWQTPEPEPPPAQAFGGGEAHAFPRVHYDDHSAAAESATAAPSHEEPAATPPSIWDEQPPASPGWDDAGSSTQQHGGAGGFSAAAASSFAEPPADDSSPFANEAHEEQVSSAVPEYSAEPAPPSWSSSAGSAEHEPAGDIDEPAGHELSEQQIDRIARRVVQLMSDQLVRNIAWEVIPDLAEMVVKERVRQLEADEN